jgi:phosphoglycerol transferase MdoB-like AlkP superfamily enzyme
MFLADKLDEFRQPFLASVFTVSSHHPFKVPPQYEGRFPKGAAPIVEVVGYTDYALNRFFNKVSSSLWYSNTIFVITADHTNESIHKEFQNNFGAYSIPLILFKPGSDLIGLRNRIVQQIDIMPTVLNYLGYEGEYIAFGNDMLSDKNESFAFNTNGNIYHLYMRDHLLEMNEGSAIGLYNYKKDALLEKNLISQDTLLKLLMQDKLKAIVQTYNSRLLDNNMTIKSDTVRK